MSEQPRIPTPLSQRFRRFRHAVLPVFSFALCVLATLWLWRGETQVPQAVGEVEAVRINVAAGSDGTLTALPRPHWTLFDRVEANAVIARLDERPVQAQVNTVQAELLRLQKELTASEEQFALDRLVREQDHRQDKYRLAWQVQQLRLDVLDRKAQIEIDRVELMRLEERVAYLEQLRGRDPTAQVELTQEQLRRDAIRKQIEQNEKAWAEADKHRNWAESHLKQYPPPPDAELQKLLGPFEAAIDVQEARLEELLVQVGTLQIRAPFSGTIAAIHAWPGQNVRLGDPIVTLAADHGRYIVSYVRQEQRVQPAVDGLVDIRARLPGAKPVTAVISRVGPQVELIPPRQRRDPARLEWGLPVRIDLPSELVVRPGELLDVQFKKKPAKAL
jgi:multidrug resistance efflux pump